MRLVSSPPDNLILTARLPAAVAIFDVIVGCDSADAVTAASQGRRADSYLRFLDKDGARLGVVHQVFTSEDACPSAQMARIGPQRERFSPPRASDRCRFGEGTFASTHGNGQDAPIPDVSGMTNGMLIGKRRRCCFLRSSQVALRPPSPDASRKPDKSNSFPGLLGLPNHLLGITGTPRASNCLITSFASWSRP